MDKVSRETGGFALKYNLYVSIQFAAIAFCAVLRSSFPLETYGIS
jgi:hypothetical protein